jgi:hypothetical protein
LSQESRKIDARFLNSPFPAKVVLGRRFDSHGATPQVVPASTIALDGQNISFDLPARTAVILVLR